MGLWSITIGTILYLIASVDFFHSQRWGLAVMYLGYTIANFGVLYIVWRG